MIVWFWRALGLLWFGLLSALNIFMWTQTHQAISLLAASFIVGIGMFFVFKFQWIIEQTEKLL